MKTRWKLGFLSSPRALTSQTSYSCIQELSRHETKKWKNMMCMTGCEREREREIEIEISGGVIKKCLHSSGLHLGNLVYK